MDISQVRFAHRFDQVTGSAIREIFKVIAQPGMISFAGGNPAPEALPDGPVSELAQYVLAKDGKAILQYGATEGYAPFLESLKAYVQDQLRVSVPAVLPVTGSTQAMDLLCKALLDPGDTVLVENPSFLGNLQCLKLYQANLVPVESDGDGLLPSDLEEKIRRYRPKLLYTIPTFQNPTGKTLPEDRRRAVAELANEYGMIVAEDDPYRDLRYEGVPCRSIKSFDQNGWVMFLGSFSKIISPGLRVGFIAGDAGIIRKCTVGKQSTDVHTANLNQAIVDQYRLRCQDAPDAPLPGAVPGGRFLHPAAGRPVHLGRASGGHGHGETAFSGRGEKGGLRTRHLLLRGRRTHEHAAPELFQQHSRTDRNRYERTEQSYQITDVKERFPWNTFLIS